ncbi:ComEC/Rec2 family competence protein [Geminicoccus roseus]|uniref:ComEC/Rec2 family competence protein n=1 Tax=Geminicoccus roseus TaxID=404900 RepID=UPI0003FF864C|nr:ComEC/Rec2 family competence protein [Geminicoccus roseus]
MQHGRTTWPGAGRWSAGSTALAAATNALPRLRRLLLAERHRWALWVPVLMGGGVLLYMVPAEEPSTRLAELALFATAAGLSLAVLAVLAGRRTRATLAILLVALPAGYLAAAWRTASVETVTLARPATLELEARILAVEGRARGHRLTLDRILVLGGARQPVPQTVRIGVAKGAGFLAPGDRIRIRARLEAPQPPALPGGYDWARDAWFQGLGAVGWSLGAPVLLQAGGQDDGLALAVEELRSALSARIAGATPGPAGAVAAALVTGQRGAVDDAIWQDMQRSGLAHLISISGLHFTLVAGVVFFLARWGLALCPPLCRRLPAQKGAAICAILACAFYLVVSGASVPAQRSFVMAVIAFSALLVDRDPISLRLLSVAAIAVLLWAPHSLLGPSFQLSFAAMVGLVALFEALARRRDRQPAAARPLWHRALAYPQGIVATTLMATLATAPFGAWHFGTIATWGVVANMLAVPLTSFAVMPAAVIGTVLIPLGLDQPAFMVMGEGVAWVLAIAATVAAWPHAAFAIPGMDSACIALIVLGGLWLAIWQQRWRLAGLPVVLLGLATALAGTPPGLFVAPDAKVAGAISDEGRLLRTPGRLDGRVADAWQTRAGTGGRPGKWEAAPDGDRAACDQTGCVIRQGSHVIAVLTVPGDPGDDCRHAQLVLDLVAERRCPLPTRTLGYRSLRAARGLEIRFAGGEPILSSLARARGDRPWTRSIPPSRLDDDDAGSP